MNDILTLVVVFPLAVAGMTVLAWFMGAIFDALGLN
jgi:hypothetical protein